MNQTYQAPRSVGIALLIAAVIGVAALAGCIGSADKDFSELAPTASLAVDRTERWTTEEFLFDGSGSTDPNGNISGWVFDFGDGGEFATEDPEAAANVSHAYDTAGVYAVTLTVTDDGENQTGKQTDTDVVVVTVNDRLEVPPQANYAAPVESDQFAKSVFPFDVHEGATAYEGKIDVASAIPAGTSAVTLRLLDPDDQVLEEQNVTVDAGENTTVDLRGALETHTNHTLEIVVTSGGASTEGTLRIYYAEDALERDDEEEEEEGQDP